MRFCFYLHLLRNFPTWVFFSKYHLHHSLLYLFIYLFLHAQSCQMTPRTEEAVTQHMTDIRAGVTPICPLWWANYFLTCLLAVVSNATSSIARPHNARGFRQTAAAKLNAANWAPRAKKEGSAATIQPLSVLQGGIAVSRKCLLASSIPPSHDGTRVQEV